MKPLTDTDKIRMVLRLIQQSIDHYQNNVVDHSAGLAALKVRQESQNEYNEDNYGGGFSQNRYDELVRHAELSLTTNKEELERWKDIYQFTLTRIFENFVK